MSSPAARPWRNTIETLLIAAAGGTLLGTLGVPVGYVSGALLAVAVAAIAGRPTYVAPPVIQLILFSLGTVIGSTVTPETVRGLAKWPLSIAMLTLMLIAVFVITSAYLRLVHRWDLLSSLFAACPGALSQVVAVSLGTHANMPAIVIVQTVRVLVLGLTIPSAFHALGIKPDAAGLLAAAAAGRGSAADVAILVCACAAAAYALQRLRFPGGVLFGAMGMSATLYGAGLLTTHFPAWLITLTSMGVGAMTGSRFGGTSLRLLLHYLLAAAGSLAIGVVTAGLFAAVTALLFPFPIADIALAFSPGAQEVMMVLVLSLAGDTVFVAGHHFARVLIVTLALPVLTRWALARSRS